MKRNPTPAIAKTLALVVILISPGFFWRLRECEAQNRMTPAEYDYYSLAIASISNSAVEASKLPDVPKRVKLLIYAAKILPPSEHDDAVRLLEVALRGVKEWGSADKTSWYQRHTAATLRNEVVAVYAVLDPEKAAALQNESQVGVESSDRNRSATSLKNEYWFTQFSDRRVIADQPAKIARSLSSMVILRKRWGSSCRVFRAGQSQMSC